MRPRTSPLLAFAVLTGCGIVYTEDEPLWYRDCWPSDFGCACPSDASRITTTPGVEECSGTGGGGGVCCDDGTTCSCAGVRCTNDASGCVCTLTYFSNPTLDALPECVPQPVDKCCMKPGVTACTCSPADCQAGETPVEKCAPSEFTCAMLARDTIVGASFAGGDTPACSAGPINAPR